MNMQLVQDITKKQLRNDIPDFKAGDTVKVYVKIKEGDKTRTQLFEGVCIAKKGGGISETFTVRKISYQVGVERTFPIHSPIIDRIEVVKIGKYVELNYIIYVVYLVKLLELKKFVNKKYGKFPYFFLVFFGY